jgi:toxin HigB-1
MVIQGLMIISFKDKRTEQIYSGQCPKGFPPDLFRRSVVKLDQLQSASILDDLRIPPSNRLEALSGDRAGQHSIRINKQWRLCFAWKEGHAHGAEITDYH